MTDELTPEQQNAVAWLRQTDDELVESSATLGLPAELSPDVGEPSGTLPTAEQIAQLREAADTNAREHAGAKFVNAWIKENRP